jgi:transposase
VQDFLHRVEASGLSYREAFDLGEDALLERIGKRREGYAAWSSEQAFFEYVSKEMKRRSMTLMLLWEEYRAGDPEGYSYSEFCARYAKWKKAHRVWMRQTHRAGDKAFIDYAGDTLDIINAETGELLPAYLFVAVLGASNYTYAEATARQDQRSWLGAQRRAFEFFGGVPAAVVPDNPKTLVTKADRYDPEFALSYADFANHYGVAVLPARVRRPQDKAKVEVGVQIAERWILARLRNARLFSVAEANERIRELLDRLNSKVMRAYGASRVDLFGELEREALRPLPKEPYVVGDWKRARVGVNYHVEYEKNHYSAPFSLIHEEVLVKAADFTVDLYHKGNRVATHQRLSGRNQYATLKEHMPPPHRHVTEWTPERLMTWAAAIGTETARQAEAIFLSRQHPEQAIRAVLGLLSLARKYGEERLEAAAKYANSFGAASMTTVSNILKNNRDRLATADDTGAKTTAHHENIRGSEYYH